MPSLRNSEDILLGVELWLREPEPATTSLTCVISAAVTAICTPVTQQIPAPPQHVARYYGAYANRKRKAMRGAEKDGTDQAASGTQCGPPAGLPEGEAAYRRPRPSWARRPHKIFEADPLLCPKCGTEMKVVSAITEPEVIDKILKHIARTGGQDPFEERGPPAEAAGSVEASAWETSTGVPGSLGPPGVGGRSQPERTCRPVQPCLWAVRGKVRPENGAARAWEPPPPGWAGGNDAG